MGVELPLHVVVTILEGCVTFSGVKLSIRSFVLFLHPTRVTDHSSAVIDNIFSNVTEYETIIGNIINRIADHFAQFLLLKKININYKNTNLYQYNYSNFNKENFVEEFSNINWNKLENDEEDIDSKFTFFCNELSRCVKTHTPLTRVSPKALSCRNKPWITDRIQRMMSK